MTNNNSRIIIFTFSILTFLVFSKLLSLLYSLTGTLLLLSFIQDNIAYFLLILTTITCLLFIYYLFKRYILSGGIINRRVVSSLLLFYFILFLGSFLLNKFDGASLSNLNANLSSETYLSFYGTKTFLELFIPTSLVLFFFSLIFFKKS